MSKPLSMNWQRNMQRSVRTIKSFKNLRLCSGMNLLEFSQYFNVPYRTVQNWESDIRHCPDYLLSLMEYKLTKENKITSTNVFT